MAHELLGLLSTGMQGSRPACAALPTLMLFPAYEEIRHGDGMKKKRRSRGKKETSITYDVRQATQAAHHAGNRRVLKLEETARHLWDEIR